MACTRLNIHLLVVLLMTLLCCMASLVTAAAVLVDAVITLHCHSTTLSVLLLLLLLLLLHGITAIPAEPFNVTAQSLMRQALQPLTMLQSSREGLLPHQCKQRPAELCCNSLGWPRATSCRQHPALYICGSCSMQEEPIHLANCSSYSSSFSSCCCCCWWAL
jgi:hypothetical protein